MGKNILFFLAGWFSVAIGFEVAPMYGNIAGVVSFLLLVLWFSHKESHLTKRAADECPTCAGLGFVNDKRGRRGVDCSDCNGSGIRR